MIRSTMLRKTMMLVLAAVLLCALLMLTIYQVVSPYIFAEQKSEQMLQQTRVLVRSLEMVLNSELPLRTYSSVFSLSASQYGAYFWLLGSSGQTLLRSQPADQNTRQVDNPADISEELVQAVLEGHEASNLGRTDSLTRTAPKGGMEGWTISRDELGQLSFATPEPEEQGSAQQTQAVMQSSNMVMVGVPILYGETVIGAIIMAQPMNEAVAGMSSMSNTLRLSMMFAVLLLLPMAYIIASHMARPLKQMRDIALSMAGGNFRVRADDQEKGEIGELGGALNVLSGELGRTISELIVERNRLRGILNGLSEGIIAIDVHGDITHVNPAVRTLFSTQDVVWRTDRLALVPSEEVWQLYKDVLTDGKDAQMNIAHGDSIIHVAISALRDEADRVVGAVGVFRDITNSEKLEQTRRDYVANVSHELRTPLTALRALIEPLRDGMVRDEEDRQEAYEIMFRETMRLTRLVSDMLELSRLQSGHLSLDKGVFDVKGLLREVYGKYQTYADDYAHQLNLNLTDKEIPPISGNPDRTEQVLVALLDNAMKYTPAGGQIEMGVVRRSDHAEVYVKDNGAGIAAQDIAHVFERFYKADKAHQGKGTGLGLAITREILRLLGETIRVESVEGEGATFIFTLHYYRRRDIATPPPDMVAQWENRREGDGA